MGWDPSVLRKYNTTGHFRLLNQLRSELKGNPLIRPKEGQTVGDANRSKSLIRAIEARAQSGGISRSRRAAEAQQVTLAPASMLEDANEGFAGANSFRDRLSAIDMR
jgi:hypothetical protein